MRASVVVCCCAAVAFFSYAKQRGEQGVAWRLTGAGVVEWPATKLLYETKNSNDIGNAFMLYVMCDEPNTKLN